MVALAVTAIALIAGLKATEALTQNASRQGELLLAHLCAENALSELRMTGRYPDVGDSVRDCDQANRRLQVTLTVQSTANPSMRRVDARVAIGGEVVLNEATIVGRF